MVQSHIWNKNSSTHRGFIPGRPGRGRASEEFFGPQKDRTWYNLWKKYQEMIRKSCVILSLPRLVLFMFLHFQLGLPDVFPKNPWFLRPQKTHPKRQRSALHSPRCPPRPRRAAGRPPRSGRRWVVWLMTMVRKKKRFVTYPIYKWDINGMLTNWCFFGDFTVTLWWFKQQEWGYEWELPACELTVCYCIDEPCRFKW